MHLDTCKLEMVDIRRWAPMNGIFYSFQSLNALDYSLPVCHGGVSDQGVCLGI